MDRYLTPGEVSKYVKCGGYGGKGVFGPEETAFGIYCYAIAELTLNMPADRGANTSRSVYDVGSYYMTDEEKALLTGRVEMAQELLDAVARGYINRKERTVDFNCEDFGSQYEESRHLSSIRYLMPAVVYYNSLKMGLKPDIELPEGMFGDLQGLRGKLNYNHSFVTNADFIESIEGKLSQKGD